MDLEQAITKHAEWKLKLRNAISKKEILDQKSISKDNCCDLGKWLHTDGGIKFGTLNSFQDVVKKHAIFHLEAGNVAILVNSKQYIQADAQLNADTSFSKASQAVAMAIMALKREAKL